MIGRAPRSRRQRAIKAEWAQFELFDKCFYYPDWVIVVDEVFEEFWKQSNLLAVFAFYESLHPATSLNALIQCRRSGRFHTLSGHCGHWPIADGAIKKSVSNVGFRKK
jgi:hypothetical protein